MSIFTDLRTVDLRCISFEGLCELSYDVQQSNRISGSQSDTVDDALWIFLMKRKLEMDRGQTNVARRRKCR